MMLRTIVFMMLFICFEFTTAGPLRTFLKKNPKENTQDAMVWPVDGNSFSSLENYDAVVTQLAQEKENTAQLRHENTILVQQLATLQQEKVSWQEKQKDNDQNILQQNQLEEQFAIMQKELQQAHQAMDATKIEKDTLSQNYAKLLKEQQETSKKLAEVEQRYHGVEDALSKNYEQKLQTFRQETVKTHQRMYQGDEKLQMMTREMLGKDQKITTLQHQMRKDAERIAHLEHHVKELNKAFTNEKDYKATYKEHIHNLRAENQQLRIDKDKAVLESKKQLRELKQQFAKLSVEYELEQQRNAMIGPMVHAESSIPVAQMLPVAAGKPAVNQTK